MRYGTVLHESLLHESLKSSLAVAVVSKPAVAAVSRCELALPGQD